jgi:hypothetical protein
MGNPLAPREPLDRKRKHEDRLYRRNGGIDETLLNQLLSEPEILPSEVGTLNNLIRTIFGPRTA